MSANEAKMFEHWMMTTNFLISVSAISSLFYTIWLNQIKTKCKCPCHSVPRPVLVRQNADIESDFTVSR